ncbi:MAG: ribosome maturation factor RimP [Eubacteriales bacterium]|nr:ribosome maturation factor RimP [Eubacteriales bacterium]
MKLANRSKVAQLVYDAALPHVESLGLELVDVEMVREGQVRRLKIYIDRRGGVSLDECTQVSRIMDPIIDQDLKLDQHDYFEVSSPGLERPLKTDQDLRRHLDEWVEISLYKALNGQKKYQGILKDFDEAMIEIETKEDERIRLNRELISRVKRMLIM